MSAPGSGARPGAVSFDAATAVTIEPGGAGGDGRYAAAISGAYNIGPVPNGGYVMAIALRAICARLPGCAPLTLTAHFLRPAQVAAARIDVEVIKEGRRYATARARLWQGEHEVVSAIATLVTEGAGAAGGASAAGAASAAGGASAAVDAAGGGGAAAVSTFAAGAAASSSPLAPLHLVDGAPPELAPQGELIAVPASDFYVIGHQFDFRLDPSCAGWMTGVRSGRADMRGVIGFADGRPPDLLSLPLFADATTPAIFGAIPFRRVPTLELTVHFRARPSPGLLRFVSRTRFAFAGHLEEDGELWDDSGQLVAQSRELAVVP